MNEMWTRLGGSDLILGVNGPPKFRLVTRAS